MTTDRFKILLGLICFIFPILVVFYEHKSIKNLATLTPTAKIILSVAIFVYWYIQYKLITRTIDFPGPRGL